MFPTLQLFDQSFNTVLNVRFSDFVQSTYLNDSATDENRALVALSSALFNTAAIAFVNSCPVSNPIRVPIQCF